MIDSFNDNATGWARFSDETPDPVMRYRLGRACTRRAAEYLACLRMKIHWTTERDVLTRVVFLMLNPSSANAFKPDPTVSECIRFARLWVPGLDLVEVVNLFAFITQFPKVMKAARDRGDDEVADQQILEACTGARLVISAWGTSGSIVNSLSGERRDLQVTRMLDESGIRMHHLGRTKEGHPKHPLARGKHRIPADQQPIP